MLCSNKTARQSADSWPNSLHVCTWPRTVTLACVAHIDIASWRSKTSMLHVYTLQGCSCTCERTYNSIVS